jgi:hypothetical protein
MTLANANALFHGLKQDPSYLANLTVQDAHRTRLTSARKDIRAALRAAAHQIPVEDTYWQDAYVAKVSRRNRSAVEVKLMTQGSFAYGTLNAPARSPQEIDLDDGMYIPVDFLDNGEPALTARGLFEFTEAALQPLCDERGWKLKEKECCVRVQIWTGAHVDIPIYSIPRERFALLSENLTKADSLAFAQDSISGPWRLPSDLVMLAHRSGKWAHSDPQLLHEWIEGRVRRYGPVYRRLCRFFKGWRDYIWDSSALSSLTIMCAIDMAIRQLDGFPTEDRDDELVMDVAKHLPRIFSGTVENPVISGSVLNNWTDVERANIVSESELLRDEMVAALEKTGLAERVVERIQNRFGRRIPYRPDVVRIASTIAAIQSAPAATVAAPRVIASTSG